MWYHVYMSSLDGRKLDHKTREAIRIRAVRRVLAGESPEVVVKAPGFSRQRIYEWLARYREGGEEALRFKGIPGRKRKLSDAQMKKLYDIVTSKNPLQLRFRFALFPHYSPDLNPGELVWSHLKNHKPGREVIKGQEHMRQRVLSILRSLQRKPARVISFFKAPKLRYALI